MPISHTMVQPMVLVLQFLLMSSYTDSERKMYGIPESRDRLHTCANGVYQALPPPPSEPGYEANLSVDLSTSLGTANACVQTAPLPATKKGELIFTCSEVKYYVG